MVKILIIDDDKVLLLQMGKILKKYNYSVDLVNNALSGFKSLESKTYDLIITDLGMPMISGFEFLQKIRSHIQTSATALAVVTGSQEAKNVIQAQQLDVSEYILKPINPLKFIQKINSALLKRSTKRQNRFEETKTSNEALIHAPAKIINITENGFDLVSRYSLIIGEEIIMSSSLFKEIGIAPPLMRTIKCRAINSSQWQSQIEFMLISTDTVNKIRDWCKKKQKQGHNDGIHESA